MVIWFCFLTNFPINFDRDSKVGLKIGTSDSPKKRKRMEKLTNDRHYFKGVVLARGVAKGILEPTNAAKVLIKILERREGVSPQEQLWEPQYWRALQRKRIVKKERELRGDRRAFRIKLEKEHQVLYGCFALSSHRNDLQRLLAATSIYNRINELYSSLELTIFFSSKELKLIMDYLMTLNRIPIFRAPFKQNILKYMGKHEGMLFGDQFAKTVFRNKQNNDQWVEAEFFQGQIHLVQPHACLLILGVLKKN